MCKVLMVTANFPPLVNGVSRVLSDICSTLNPENLIVLAPWCVNIMKSGDYNVDSKEVAKNFDANLNYKIIRYTFSMRTKVNTIISTAWLTVLTIYYALKNKVDIVYFGKPFPVATAGIILRLLKIPYVVHCHGSELVRSRGKLSGFLRDYILLNAFKVLTVSRWTKKTCLALGCTHENTHIIHPKVDINRFNSLNNVDNFKTKERLENKKIILTVAHINYQKGQHLVIDELPDILTLHNDVVYIVAGYGPDKEKLVQRATELGIEKHVIFPGNRDIEKFFSICDIFVMPSLYLESGYGGVESFGVVYLEASACKKPVIGSNHGGIPDAVEDGVSGILIETGNKVQLKNSLLKLLDNPEYAKLLGQQGYDRVVNYFTIDKYADEMKKYIFKPLKSNSIV